MLFTFLFIFPHIVLIVSGITGMNDLSSVMEPYGYKI